MGISQVTLKVIFPRKILVTSYFWTDERSFLVVAAHVGFETTWSVESLPTAVNLADKVPLSTSLALRSPSTVVGEVYFLVCRIV